MYLSIGYAGWNTVSHEWNMDTVSDLATLIMPVETEAAIFNHSVFFSNRHI